MTGKILLDAMIIALIFVLGWLFGAGFASSYFHQVLKTIREATKTEDK